MRRYHFLTNEFQELSKYLYSEVKSIFIDGLYFAAMSKLKKCLYLINLMERKGAMTLKEINDCYEYSSLYEGEEIL